MRNSSDRICVRSRITGAICTFGRTVCQISQQVPETIRTRIFAGRMRLSHRKSPLSKSCELRCRLEIRVHPSAGTDTQKTNLVTHELLQSAQPREVACPNRDAGAPDLCHIWTESRLIWPLSSANCGMRSRRPLKGRTIPDMCSAISCNDERRRFDQPPLCL